MTTDAYQRNYDQIAHDHIQHWRRTNGGNPFQGTDHVKANRNETVRLIQQHTQPCRWLDAGCGMGDLLQKFPAYESVGVDIADAYLELARDRGLNVTNAEIENLPFANEQFGLVTCVDVLEHVFELDRCVHQLIRVLKPGGTLIVRTPNDEDLEPFIKYTDYEYVHVRSFSHAGLWLLFHKIHGLEVIEIPVFGHVIHAVVRK